MENITKVAYSNIIHYANKSNTLNNDSHVMTELSEVQPQKNTNNTLVKYESIDDLSLDLNNNTSLPPQQNMALPNPISKLIPRKGRMIMLLYKADESPIICIGPQCILSYLIS